jgi:RNA polymerase sigma-70 factor (ECF subfamily)
MRAETIHRTEEPELRDAMDRYATGDFSAFEVLYDRLAPRLRAMLRRRRCNAALTEDIIQQTFLRIHCARAHYRRDHEVVPWAYAIARRLLIDAWRREQREEGRSERVGEAAIPGPEDELIAGETARRLERGLDALPPLHREAFSLVKFDGLSLEQTAQVLGTSVTAIKLRIHRAYQSLRSAAQGSK